MAFDSEWRDPAFESLNITFTTISAPVPGGSERRLTLFTLSCCRK